MAAMDLPQRPLERPLPATASPTERQPLHARALYQDVAERLRQKIFNREIEPGGWIDEQRIAAEYGISRTPLREALKVLAVEGLVTMKLRRGAYVTEMSSSDVAQVYHLMALLEADAAGRAAAQATDAELSAHVLPVVCHLLVLRARQVDRSSIETGHHFMRVAAIHGVEHMTHSRCE